MKPVPTVLFVDDEPEVTRALQRSLRAEPFRILVADSAEDALRIMARESVDVLITDESMPGTRGSEMLARTRKTHPNVTTMVLTGHAAHESKIQDLAEGNIQRFLAKPCDAVQIASAIHEALRERDHK